MKQALYALALLFCLFPYTQIFEIESYNQPYALLLCGMVGIVALPLVQREFPRNDLYVLIALAVAGAFTFLVTCLPNPNTQEFKYLLIYISPIIFAVAAFAVIREYPRMADRIVVASALIWMFVGVVQTLVEPSFMTQFVGSFSDSATVVVDSGRGTLGLAPEPTHFGFHMLILATLLAVIGGRNLLSIACVLTAIVVARSSSALLAIILGGFIYLLIFGGWWRSLLIATVPMYYLIGVILNLAVLPEDLRIVQLMSQFYADPFYLITSDGSANARLGGIWVGMKEIAGNSLLPAGLSHDVWMTSIGIALAKNPWLIFLSESGIPSGLLIVIYQLGVIGLGLILYILFRILTGIQSQIETLLLCAIVFVFMSQYYLSTPGFGLLLGVVVARRMFAGEASVREPASDSSVWEGASSDLPPLSMPKQA